MNQAQEMTVEQEERFDKLLDVLKDGLTDKHLNEKGLIGQYITERDDEKKGAIAQQIDDQVDFELTESENFPLLCEHYRKVKSQHVSILETERTYLKSKEKGTLVTNWTQSTQKSLERLGHLQGILRQTAKDVAVSSLNKSR